MQEGSCREDSWAFQWGMSNASAEWEAALGWPPDPEWTESNWPPAGVPQYRLYQVGGPPCTIPAVFRGMDERARLLLAFCWEECLCMCLCTMWQQQVT